MKYHGYWFYGLRNNYIFQANDLIEEYYFLNCPQEFAGPFESEEDAELFQAINPGLSEKFNKDLQDYWEYCNQEIVDDEKFWNDYIYQDKLC